MAFTRTQKRSAAESSNPLCQAGIVEQVLSYVGPGHWWFVSTVCSLWRGIYGKVAAVQMRKVKVARYTNVRKKEFTCVPQMTLFSSIFAAPSRMQLAQESGVNCNSAQYQFTAGRCADSAALAAAIELGMHKTRVTTVGAACGNTLAVMRFLRAEGFPWGKYVAEIAASRGDMLRWLCRHGCHWSPNYAYTEAAGSGNIAMVRWIKKQEPNVTRMPIRDLSDEELRPAEAAFNGHTAMCAYLREHDPPTFGFEACRAAARGGHADTLRWLRRHGYQWDLEYIDYNAAEGGSVEVLRYLQQEDIEFEYSADCSSAVA
jgi:hypothetical protein